MLNSREQLYTGIILKKQPLSEADELLTFYTKEIGKIRAVAKSSKLPKSKLQHQLQPMFLCNFTLAGSGTLAKIIRIETQEVFRQIYNAQDRIQLWYVAAELVMRATPDEQVNLDLYDALNKFLVALNAPNLSSDQILLILIKFKLEALDALGLGIQIPDNPNQELVFFSNTAGGFVGGEKPLGSLVIPQALYSLFLRVIRASHTELLNIDLDPEQLNNLISEYIAYQLEREIRAEKFISLAKG